MAGVIGIADDLDLSADKRMSIVSIVAGDQTFEPGAESSLPGKLRRLVECGRRALRPDPFDPMEKAFRALAARAGCAEGAPEGKEELVRSYGLRQDLLAVKQVWKGAPEAISAPCRLDPATLAALARDVDIMARDRHADLSPGRSAISRRESLPESPTGSCLAIQICWLTFIFNSAQKSRKILVADDFMGFASPDDAS